MKRIHLFAALAVLALSFAAQVHAADVPIVSMKRLGIAAQIGAQWQRETSANTGFESKPSIKLVPAYRLYGPESGLAKGSIALVFPVEATFTTEHAVRFGIYLSCILWDGSDAK